MIEEELADDLNGDDIDKVVVDGEEDEHSDGQFGGSDNKEERNEPNEKDKEKTKTRRKLGPRPTLNAERLKGPRGIGIMEAFFSDIKLHGKGREKEDLDLVVSRLEHWTHRLFPRMQFDDSLKKIEKLGHKKEVANLVKRIRLGMEDMLEDNVLRDELPDSPPPTVEDPFDQLLSSTAIPIRPAANTDITEEQRERMLRNRLIAEERRAARIKRAQEMKERFRNKQTTENQEERVAGEDIVSSSVEVIDRQENLEIIDKQENLENKQQIVILENITDKNVEVEESVSGKHSEPETTPDTNN